MPEGYRFGRLEIHPSERALRLDGAPVALGARAFDLLLALVERRDRTVSKHELLDQVWAGLVVEENNLQVQISTLRRLLGSAAIATVPGRGYRFTMAASPQLSGAELPTPAGTHLHAPPSALPSALPSARPSSQPATQPPAQLPPLIGRDDDRAALADLLAAHRLVTLVGATGMGKTRLAQHLLWSQREALEHGVAWVELAPVTDVGQLVGNLAAALGLRTGDGEPLAALVRSLRPLAVLVALDNAEHLVDAVSTVAQALLDGCPQLRLLVTSQTPLKLEAERIYRLGGLGLPAAADTPLSAAEALRHGAVALFVERAQAADRRFRLDEGNVAIVVDICRQLDGMALALELAAARVPLLGVAGLRSALADRLRVLTGGHRGAPPRQQTLRAALAWSVGLLSPVEQRVFCRLGVFAGGFTLELARQVAADPPGSGPIDEWGVLEALGALVDRSLVGVDGEATPRYALLASPRLLALERLDGSGELEAVRERHARAISTLFADRDADLQAGRLGHDPFVRLLEPELDNARAALAWSLPNRPAWAVALAPALTLALGGSRSPERLAVWDQTAAAVDTALPLAQRARWHLGAGRPQTIAATTRLGWLRTALALYRELGDPLMVHRAIADLLSMAAHLEEAEREALHAELLALEQAARARGTLSARQQFFGQQAEAFYRAARGELAAAEAANQRMLGLAEAIGNSSAKVTVLNNLADSALAAGRVDEAVRRGRERVASLVASRDRAGLAYARLNLANALLMQGDAAGAREQAALGAPAAALFALEHDWADVLAGLAAQEGRPRTAAHLCGHADAAYAGRAEVRERNEARIRAQAEAAARAALGDAEFAALREMGGGLDFATAARLALGDDDTA
ncbi:MAG: winged helix-turn-helix domain-containing protein [Burkholderiaceae bacterium]|nr:winged helix-turn-helix domain-containing protein [Burkholderiaceae bacterium]